MSPYTGYLSRNGQQLAVVVPAKNQPAAVKDIREMYPGYHLIRVVAGNTTKKGA